MNSFASGFRILGFALVAAMGLGFAFADEPPVRILTLGDSLTFGVAGTEAQGGYRNRLFSVLSDAGFNVDFVGNQMDDSNPTLPDVNHEGHRGFLIHEIQANIGEWLRTVEDPDVILLLIGTNDVWQNLNLAQAPDRLSNLIADIATRRPFAKIILSSLPPRIDIGEYEDNQVTFNDALQGIVDLHIALGRQVELLDMHTNVLTPFDYSTDGVHPSTSGYEKMADAWAIKIAKVIKPSGTANPPVIARTGPQPDLTHLPIVFSKPVADDAVNLANFSLSGGLTVSNAELDDEKRTVTLTTSTQTPGLVYSVSVSGVRDRTGQQNLIAPESMATFSPGAVTNGSFESDYASWTVTGNQEIKSSSPYTATDGVNIVAFNTGNSATGGTLSQTFATTVGQTYQLKFDFGVYAFNNASQQELRVDVEGGAGTLVSDLLGINRNGGGGGVVWESATYVFTAVTPTTTLTFTDESTETASLDLLLDNVRVGALATRYLSVTSSSSSGAAMTITPIDTAGNGNGSSGLIRNYNEGVSVTITAAATHEGGDFLRWRKNGVDLVGSIPTINITMDGNHALTAVYETVIPPDEFAQWLEENNLVAGPGDDSDGDSLSNAVEYVVGGDPVDSPDTQLSPTVERVSADLDENPGGEDYLLFMFRRTDRAHLDPSTAIKVEWSADLAGPWTDSGQTPGVIVDEVEAGAGVKLVKVYLPRSLQVDGRFFARLKVGIQSAP